MVDHEVEVVVDGALVHLHDLAVDDVLALAQRLLGLALAGLLDLAQLAVDLGDLDHLHDLALLLEPEQLLGQTVHGLRNHVALSLG